MTKTKVSSEDVLAALGEHPNTTATELAEALGLGQSTVSKHLAALEAAATARREAGGRDGGRRIADRWSTVAAPAVAEVGKDEDEGTGDETTRLGRGELSTLVLDYLTARPDETFGPTQVGKDLGRSQGAVANALARFADSGRVRLVGDAPRRYQAVG
ncbi:MAG: winged helix-turn-helix domain-containing protein [Actinomycetota bacterium]|jgi:DNA-binding MarR family transcriptional regulator|nr:winged helix-turn-helix domain-containing protein [Actinomycetota bacterium]